MSIVSTIKSQFDSCTSENRGKLWSWYKQCVYEGYPEIAFKVGIKLIPGNMSFYWDSVFAYYFSYIGPANPILFIHLNKLKYMETTNSVGMVSILLSKSPKTSIVMLAKNLCSTWYVPSAKDATFGEPSDWKTSLEKYLISRELFQSLYYANLLFNTKKTIPNKIKNAKLYIWKALLEMTSNHWLIYQMFTISMSPQLQWKPITFDMIIHCIHLIVTESLNEIEPSETEITSEIRSWVEALEKIPIKNFSDDHQKVPEDSFWTNMSQIYLQSSRGGTTETGETTEPTEQKEQIEQIEPTEPTEPTEPIEPTEPKIHQS